MIARYAGATLGLAAFATVIIAGLFTQNPITVTLSRSILALFLFCILGYVLGGAAQMVVNEQEKTKTEEIQRRYRKAPEGPGDSGAEPATPVTDGGTAGV